MCVCHGVNMLKVVGMWIFSDQSVNNVSLHHFDMILYSKDRHAAPSVSGRFQISACDCELVAAVEWCICFCNVCQICYVALLVV